MAVVVLQRCIPHYRDRLFLRLWEALGWTTVAASNFPEHTSLDVVREPRPYLRRFPFRFPREGDERRCFVPTGRILRELEPSAVIAEFSLQMSSTYQLLVHRHLQQGPQVVFWSHGYNMDRGLGFRGVAAQLPRALLGLCADGHVVYSREGREFLERFIVPERISVVRNSLAFEGPLHPAERSEGAPHGRPAIVSIGRFTADKAFPALVRVFRRLCQSFPSATLSIVGDGPALEAVRREAGSLLDRSIHLPGAIYDEERLSRLFAGADVAVFCGAVGLSVNHALFHGVPVVAFERTHAGPRHHPEIEYVVDGVTGLRVTPYRESAMVQALARFLAEHRDPRNDFRNSIRNFVEENLTLGVMIRDFAEVERMIERLQTGRKGS